MEKNGGKSRRVLSISDSEYFRGPRTVPVMEFLSRSPFEIRTFCKLRYYMGTKNAMSVSIHKWL